jgi:hypothetical protein
MDARPAQVQASLKMFIPDYLPLRQVKSIDHTLVSMLLTALKRILMFNKY